MPVWNVRASSFVSYFLFGMAIVAAAAWLTESAEQRAYKEYHAQKQREEALRFAGHLIDFGVADGPITEEERKWLAKEAASYGLAIRYESAEGTFVSPDGGTAAAAEQAVRTPIVVGGETRGILALAYRQPYNADGIPESGYRQAHEAGMRLYWTAGTLVAALAALVLAVWQSRAPARLARRASRIRIGENAPEPERGALAGAFEAAEWRTLRVALNELAAQLDRQEEVRRRLLQDLTHEFRTPVTSMITELEAIVDGVFAVSEERLKDMYGELERLSRLIADMEQLFDAEGARFKLEVARHDIVHIVQGVYKNFLPYAKEKGVTVRFEHPHKPIFAEVDQDRIVQIAINLLTNALKFMREDVPGELTVGVAGDEDEVSFYCEDNGIGIAAEDAPLIFDRFYRANRFGRKRTFGFGVGLSICKALTEAHDGTIAVKSEPGRGSRFTVTIPALYKRAGYAQDGGQSSR